ncbi:hypothetical protein DFH06DRAFT_1196634 [Mycena polygramma]|nr:hypothetical protein DFH06DRAFT_1196634 [Mycena polygramma]
MSAPALPLLPFSLPPESAWTPSSNLPAPLNWKHPGTGANIQLNYSVLQGRVTLRVTQELHQFTPRPYSPGVRTRIRLKHTAVHLLSVPEDFGIAFAASSSGTLNSAGQPQRHTHVSFLSASSAPPRSPFSCRWQAISRQVTTEIGGIGVCVGVVTGASVPGVDAARRTLRTLAREE